MMAVHFAVVRFEVVHYFDIQIQNQASILNQVLLFHHLLQTFLRRRYFAQRQLSRVREHWMMVVMAYVKVSKRKNRRLLNKRHDCDIARP